MDAVPLPPPPPPPPLPSPVLPVPTQVAQPFPTINSNQASQPQASQPTQSQPISISKQPHGTPKSRVEEGNSHSDFGRDEEELQYHEKISVENRIVYWTPYHRACLIQIMKARSGIKGITNKRLWWSLISEELERQTSVFRSALSCQSYWARTIAGTMEFGSGLDMSESAAGNAERSAIPPESLSTPNATNDIPLQKKSESWKSFRFTDEQKAGLEQEAENSLNPDREARDRIAAKLGITHRQVMNWFGNARAAHKKRVGENGDGAEMEDRRDSMRPVRNAAIEGIKKRKRIPDLSSSENYVDSDDDVPFITQSRVRSHANPNLGPNGEPALPGHLWRKAGKRDPSLPLLSASSFKEAKKNPLTSTENRMEKMEKMIINDPSLPPPRVSSAKGPPVFTENSILEKIREKETKLSILQEKSDEISRRLGATKAKRTKTSHDLAEVDKQRLKLSSEMAEMESMIQETTAEEASIDSSIKDLGVEKMILEAALKLLGV
ncbi:hypothetical protein LZ554_001944 [Drepanopeziza brunnea f. sp. 'monogermtubi']|nr:hypothetical protein LZ554_001944 [Drepanopeziza brunnea f. sp. 'monogermtubi']